MTRRWLLGTGALAGAFFAAPSWSRIVETSPGRFDCSAPAGHYERADVGQFAEGNVITGRIRMIKTSPTTQWAASAGIIFALEGNRTAGVLLSTSAHDPGHLFVAIKIPGRGSGEEVRRVSREGYVDVSASLQNGILTVRSGRRVYQVNIGPTAASASAPQAHCKGGHFEIDVSRSREAPAR